MVRLQGRWIVPAPKATAHGAHCEGNVAQPLVSAHHKSAAWLCRQSRCGAPVPAQRGRVGGGCGDRTWQVQGAKVGPFPSPSPRCLSCVPLPRRKVLQAVCALGTSCYFLDGWELFGWSRGITWGSSHPAYFLSVILSADWPDDLSELLFHPISVPLLLMLGWKCIEIVPISTHGIPCLGIK